MRAISIITLILCTSGMGFTQEKAPPKTIGEKTAKLQKLDGFIPLYWDAAEGKLFMEISRFNSEFLYQVSLASGLGSNPVGLDRGQPGSTHVVFFARIGPKILLVQPNYRYRAISSDPAERRAVEDSFARSVLWGFTVEASDGDRVLVDATKFFLRDAHGVADRLRRTRQGRYRLDESRSAIFLPRTQAFPKNTEVETIATFGIEEDPGAHVSSTTPVPQAVTVRQHHSLVELPNAEYSPRKLDPRVGCFAMEFYDYAAPISEPIEKRWIARHRLKKKDPSAQVSEPVAPIVYYVDGGTPEPVRSALIEGAAWWNEAFEAAGFKNAFQVRVLPADADPMDVRYNVINWVHRSTRGWAYGSSIVDPRTGEIIRGIVTLDSLRARQDYLIASSLVPPYNPGAGNQIDYQQCELGFSPDAEYLLPFDPSADLVDMSIARIRQLSAHEVGHTLGLSHNFAASTYGRASVMDYPAPLVTIRSGRLDLSNAYSKGIGAYDRFAIKYAYSDFGPGADEAAELERLLREGVAGGMLFVSDADARPPGAAHPLANLWDNGDDPIKMLRHEMEVRRIGLAGFGIGNISMGTPLSMLEAKLLPLYLHHRYQLQAAVKSLGGVHYTYAVKTAAGASPSPARKIVPAERQRAALDAVLETIEVDELAIPQRILEMIPPRAFGYGGGTTELFTNRTHPLFDPIGAATVAADLAISALLQQNRAARLIEFHAHSFENPDFTHVVDAIIGRTFKKPFPANAYHAAITRAVQSLTVTRLIELAANDSAAPQVRAAATNGLRQLAAYLKLPARARIGAAHRTAVLHDIERFLSRPDPPGKQTEPLPAPPGDPIGTGKARE